jgi:hypothetical protein
MEISAIPNLQKKFVLVLFDYLQDIVDTFCEDLWVTNIELIRLLKTGRLPFSL